MKKILTKIFNAIKHKQSVGIDGISSVKYAEIIEQELEIIERKIKNGSYNFSFYRQKLVAKSSTESREIAIPTIRDKIVLKYLNGVLLDNFKFELSFDHPASSMIQEIIQNKNHYECFIKVDVKNFFPSINHELLMNVIKSKLNDPLIIDLIEKAIKQSTVAMNSQKSSRTLNANKHGIPQGLSISQTLASIYISDIIQKYCLREDLKLYKFVDDILILCEEKELSAIQLDLESEFQAKKLQIHGFSQSSEKSSIGKTSERFEYLGYVFDGAKITVRHRSVQNIYKNIVKEFTKYKYGNHNLETLYETVNVKIAGCASSTKKYGWINYYSQINDETILKQLDVAVAKQCKKAKIPYDTKFKKFSRAFYEIKDDTSGYIPECDSFSDEMKNRIINFIDDDLYFYGH